MKAVVQRVLSARVTVDAEETGAVGPGLLVFLGVAPTDTMNEARALARRIVAARVFADAEGRMNLAIRDIGGAILAVSQFTLLGDTSQRRPYFGGAMAPGPAETLYGVFCDAVRSEGVGCATGTFGAHMRVESVNDGPVTLLYEETP